MNFLLFINDLAKTSVTMFPIIFNDGLFIGCYNETKIYMCILYSYTVFYVYLYNDIVKIFLKCHYVSYFF